MMYGLTIFSTQKSAAKCIVVDNRTEYQDIYGTDCNNIKINGLLAYQTDSYPQVKVEYSWEICNYNDNNITVRAKAADDDQDTIQTHFRLWQNRKRNGPSGREVLFEANFPPPMVLEATFGNNCIRRTETMDLDTAVPMRWMASQLSGPPFQNGKLLNDDKPQPYCYAYAFTPVEVQYGDCNVEVRIVFLGNLYLDHLSNLTNIISTTRQVLPVKHQMELTAKHILTLKKVFVLISMQFFRIKHVTTKSLISKSIQNNPISNSRKLNLISYQKNLLRRLVNISKKEGQ